MVKLLLVAGANCQHRRYAVEAGENKCQRGMAAHTLIVPFLFLEHILQPKRKAYNTNISKRAYLISFSLSISIQSSI